MYTNNSKGTNDIAYITKNYACCVRIVVRSTTIKNYRKLQYTSILCNFKIVLVMFMIFYIIYCNGYFQFPSESIKTYNSSFKQ